MINYLPHEQRTPDIQYKNLLITLRHKGQQVFTQHEEYAFRYIGYQLRYDLRNGFPIHTERDLVGGNRSGFHQALGELFAFLHGAHTLAELESFGCYWWAPDITPEKCAKRGLEPGDLGPGSYGPAWCAFPTAEGRPFNQIHHLLEQLEELPHLRTHLITPWIPQYVGRGTGKRQQVVVAPCHGWFHVFADPPKRELALHHFQRSADSPVGLVFNIIQYAALTLMLAQVIDYEATYLIYTISDGHFYRKQLSDVEDLIAASVQPFPTVTIDPSVTELTDFRQEHFVVKDYHPSLPRRKIWTPR